MASQTLIFTALPNGFVNDRDTMKCVLSVFVSPRLQPDADETLAPFDLVEWPLLLQAGQFMCSVIAGGVPVPASVVTRADIDRWRSLFDASTFVRPYQPDVPSGVISSYPAAHLQRHIKAIYQEVAARSPLDPASTEFVAAALPDTVAAFRQQAFEQPAPTATNTERRHLLTRALLGAGDDATRAGHLQALVDLALENARQSRSPAGFPDFTPLVPESVDRENPFAAFLAFHRQPSGSLPRPRAARDTEIDFHQRVAALGEYPAVLRELGLIIDLVIDLDDLPEASMDMPGRLRVVPQFSSGLKVGPGVRAPNTAYAYDRARLFRPASRGAGGALDEFVGGLLNLRLPIADDPQVPQFTIIQNDIDTAGLRTLELLRAAASDSRTAPTARDRATDAGVAAIRTAGISVVRHGHAGHLHTAMEHAFDTLASVDSPEEVTLFADDLIRGWRVDVRDSTSRRWRSLHQRVGTYRFPGVEQPLSESDEGSVQPALAQPVETPSGPAPTSLDSTRPGFTSESLVLWNGWSHAVPRSMKSLPIPGERTGPSPSPSASAPLGLATQFAAPHRSLPRLRFGERYHLRLRAVDLAGNGVSVTEADDVVAALETPGVDVPPQVLPPSRDGFRFLRFEPIGAPSIEFGDVAPRRGAHESVEHVVLRSNHDLTPEQYVAMHPVYRHAAERRIAPPLTSQWMAETHGRFDASIGTGRDFERTYALAGRERGGPAGRMPDIPDPMAGGATLRGLPGVPSGTVGRIRDGRLEFEPLPDELAEAGSIVTIDFGTSSDWPDAPPFLLRLAEGIGPPSWQPRERVLTILLPKAASASVRVSCFMHGDADLEQMGIWGWMNERLDAQVADGTLTELERARQRFTSQQLSVHGLAWMMTPFRELTLTHAVQQPVEVPAVVSFPDPLKLSDRTFAYVRGRVRVHGASTEKLELIARWEETVDDAKSVRPPEPMDCETVVFSTRLDTAGRATADGEPTAAVPPATFDSASSSVHFHAPDVTTPQEELRLHASGFESESVKLHRALQALPPHHPLHVGGGVVPMLTPIIGRLPVDRQWEKWPPEMERTVTDIVQLMLGEPTGSPPDIPPHVNAILVAIDTRAQAAKATAEQLLSDLARFRGRHECGDTRFRHVTYELAATSAFGEHFVRGPDDEALPLTRSTTVDADILSSASPPPLDVHNIIPVYFWSKSLPTAVPIEHQRVGGGVRIYLGRPWFVSGAGEMLGVVLAPPLSTARDFSAMERFVTQWGRDPIRKSASLPLVLSHERFRAPGVVLSSIQLQELEAPARVTVVGFPVDFDEAGRCFCDLRLDPGQSYYPFVRLALVRVQPKSVEGLEVSPVVITDFVQLTPDRGVTIAPVTPDVFDVTITGHTHDSPSDPVSAGEQRGSRIRITVQRRIAGTLDDAGWLPAEDVMPIDGMRDGPNQWTARVSMPSPRASGECRLLIEEVETYQGNDGAIDRVIFADAIEL
jgi:hypothetical protein